MKKTIGYHKFNTAPLLILAVLLSQIIIAVKTIPASQLDQSPNPNSSDLDSSATKRFMPFVAIPDTFGETPTIWVHTDTPAPHEVALFRKTFELGSSLNAATVQIFADTRYEVWIDGNWVGRGPARFSRTLHEYDTYTLESLTPGSHLIAVLVQWSPNVRRSESNTPLLQLRLLGEGKGGLDNILQTGTNWKAMLSSAWEHNPALVHKNKLIGATELVDFRRLSENWMYPDYADSDWQNAVLTDPTIRTYQISPINTIQPNTLSTQNPLAQRASLIPIPSEVSAIKYEPRSIPFLQNSPKFPQVIEVGYLSPGRTLIEPPTSAYSLSFSSPTTKTFPIELLAPSGISMLTNSVHLNGQPLTWRKAGAVRPDVMLANPLVHAGMYTLTLDNTTKFPVFTLPDTLNAEFPPYEQTNHAGYKNLISEPVPNANAVTSGESGELTFEQTPAYAILVLDRVTHGRFSANVTGPDGTVLTIGWDERLYQDTRPLPYPGSLHPEWNQTDSWLLDGTSRQIRTLDTRSGRYLLLTVWGEGPVTVENLVVHEELNPASQLGVFDSSNDLLDQIWQVGVDTTLLNMTDAYADPWRERGQWWGDATIINRSNRVAFGDTALLRRGLQFMADGFQEGKPPALAPNGNGINILDFGMLWVQSLAEYIQITADNAFLADMYPTLKAFLNYLIGFENRDTGLLDLPLTHWSNGVYLDPIANMNRYGQSTAINSFYVSTLLKAASLARAYNRAGDVGLWEQKATTIQTKINSLLYLPQEGRYLTTIFDGIKYEPTTHAQAWPLAFGLVPSDETEAVAESLLEMLSDDPTSPNVEIYGMAWVLEALGQNGYIPEALDIIQTYYGYMIDAGATTWWEQFNSDKYYWSSLSHGWGSSPTWFLSTYVLGGRWVGHDTWEVRPAFSGVEAASGAVPLPSGLLDIAWTRESCTHSYLDVTSPTGTNGNIILPLSKVENLVLNDVLILDSGIPLVDYVSIFPDRIEIFVNEAGNYHLDIQEICE